MTAAARRWISRAIAGSLALIGGCAPATPPVRTTPGQDAVGARDEPRLARYMRELVNVPFSFAMLEHGGERRPARYRSAALVLQGVVGDLSHWQALPVGSPEGRAVFYEYARHLERQVARLEVATRRHDAAETGARLEDIRQTCNSCHRFFRPGGTMVPVAGDVHLALERGSR